MQGTPKAIQIQGIVRNATVIGAQDGQAEDLINLRFMDGSWRASGDGRLINFTMGAEYTQLYVHTNVYHHLLGVNNGTIYWFAEIGTDGTTFYPLDNTTSRTNWPQDMQPLPTAPVALTTVVGDIWITQTGHLLTIIDESDDFEYLVFKTGEEKYVEVNVDVNGTPTDRSLYPFGKVHFNLTTDDIDPNEYGVSASSKKVYAKSSDHAWFVEDVDQFVWNSKQGIDYSHSSACTPRSDEDVTKSAAKLWHAQMLEAFNKALEGNQFTMPFLAIAAIKLYDGSYAYASNPTLLFPRDRANYLTKDYANMHYAPLPNGEWTDTAYNTTCLKIEHLSTIISNQILEDFSDVHPTYTSASNIITRNIALSEDPLVLGYLCMSTVVRGADIVISLGDNILNAIRKNDDVFKSISIFVTQQSPIYKMGAGDYKYGDVFSYLSEEGDYLKSYVSYRPKHREPIEIKHDLLNSPFYLLREYGIDEFEALCESNVIKLEGERFENYLKNITSKEILTYEATSHTTYIPKVSYIYNNRLHIANYKSYPFSGYPIDLFHLHNHSVKAQADSWFKGVLPNLTGNNDDYLQYVKAQKAITNYADLVTAEAPYFLVKVYIDSSQGEQVVCRYIPAYDPNNSPYPEHTADFIEDLNPLLTYPDARAKKMEIYYVNSYTTGSILPGMDGVYVKWQDFQLKPHPYQNMAYYIDPDLKPIKLADFKNLRETQPLAVE